LRQPCARVGSSQRGTADPFFTTKAAGEGTGLGLYISKRIVQALGGRIELLPREPHGTVVRISLPPARKT
jgi:two-component system sensor histidine kinase RegB